MAGGGGWPIHPLKAARKQQACLRPRSPNHHAWHAGRCRPRCHAPGARHGRTAGLGVAPDLHVAERQGGSIRAITGRRKQVRAASSVVLCGTVYADTRAGVHAGYTWQSSWTMRTLHACGCMLRARTSLRCDFWLALCAAAWKLLVSHRWCVHLLPQALKPPSKLKRKAVYFAKLAKAAVTAESVASSVCPALQHSRARAQSRGSAAVTPGALSAEAHAGRLWRAGRGAAGGAGHAQRRGCAAAAVQPGHAGRPPRAGGARRGGFAAQARRHGRGPGSHPGWVDEQSTRALCLVASQVQVLRRCVRAQRRSRWGTCAGRRCCRCRRPMRLRAARAPRACACWRRRWRPGCARSSRC